LEWTHDVQVESLPGVRLTEESWLRTTAPMADVARRIRDANAFTLRVVCATADRNQTRPARIVSNSVDPNRRNFTVGQELADLVFRLRNPALGDNGYPPEFIVPGVFSALEERDILITYDGATLLAAVAGRPDVVRADLSPGVAAALMISPDSINPQELQLHEVAFTAGLFLIPGVVLAVLGEGTRQKVLIGGVWVAVFALLLEMTVALVSGRPVDALNVALTSIIGCVVLIAASAVFAPIRSEIERPPDWRMVSGVRL
jgi:hypothetical protein